MQQHSRRLVHANNPRDSMYFYVSRIGITLYIPGTPESQKDILSALSQERWHIASIDGKFLFLSTRPPRREWASRKLLGARCLPHKGVSAFRLQWGFIQRVEASQKVQVVGWDADLSEKVICFELSEELKAAAKIAPRPPEYAKSKPGLRVKSFADLPAALAQVKVEEPAPPAVQPLHPAPAPVPPVKPPRLSLEEQVRAKQLVAREIAAALGILNRHKDEYGSKLQYRIAESGKVAAAFVREIQ